MAITVITQPQELSTAYNECFVTFSSTNKNNSGFRYIVDLYINGSMVLRERITPMPVTLNGKMHLSKLISSRLTYNELFPSESEAGAVSGLNKAYVDVQLKIGEEYFGNTWAYVGFGFAGAINWTNFNNPQVNPFGLSRTMLYNTTNVQPPYVAGDYIVVTQTDPLNGILTGIHKVLDKEDINTGGIRWILVLELQWQQYQTPSSFTGTTTYADGRKTTTLDLLTTNTWALWNGSLPVDSFNDYDHNDYTMNGATKLFMTSVPRGRDWVVRPDSVIFLQYRNRIVGEASFELVLEDSDGYDAYNIDTAPNTDKVVMVEASPVRRTPLGARYDAYLVFDVGQASEKLGFRIDHRCYEFGDVEICFMDRLGSIMPFQFNLRKTKKSNVKKDTIKIDNGGSTMYNIDLLEGGEIPVNITEDITWTLRTDALNYEEADYLRELISSPFTVVRFGSGDYQRCVIVTKDLEVKDRYAGGLHYYDIDIRLSNQESVNW